MQTPLFPISYYEIFLASTQDFKIKIANQSIGCFFFVVIIFLFVNDFLRFFPHSIYNGITFHNGEKIFTLPTNEYIKYNSCVFPKIAKGIKYHRPVRSTKDGTAYRKRTAVPSAARRQKQFFVGIQSASRFQDMYFIYQTACTPYPRRQFPAPTASLS